MCRKEVSLAAKLHKPIIPILMENITWPPKGPMALTFTELLYINFAKDPTQKEFRGDKFDGLLQKIKEHATVEDVVTELAVTEEKGPEEQQPSAPKLDVQLNENEPEDFIQF